MSPQPGPSVERRSPPWLLLLLLAAFAFGARMANLESDPPASMPEATPMDEGLWADGARGKVLFDDWWADDTGNAVLMAPGHAVVQWAVYRAFGLGLWQTRLPSAAASALLCVVLGLAAWRWLGRRAALLAGLLLIACPLLDQHGHMGLLESEQLCCIALAFALLFAERRRTLCALLAGAAMGLAFAIKPNATTIGAVPIGLAFLAEWRAAAQRREQGVHRAHLTIAAACMLGGIAALLPFAAWIWLPFHREWLEAAHAEMGNDDWSLGGHLLRLGLFFDRENEAGVHRLWAPLRHAPALALGLWLWALGRRGRAWLPGERAVAVWVLATMAIVETSYMHVGRRQLLALPGCALLIACHLRTARASLSLPPPRERRWLDWTLLTLPLFVAAKPLVCNLAQAWSGGRIDGYQSGLLFFVPWLLVPLLLARRFDPAPWRTRLCALSPLLLLALLAFDASRLAAWHDHGDSLRRAQDALRGSVAAGATVLGQNGTILLLDSPVRTPRRVLPEQDFATPRPNPGVFERLHPRYLLDYRPGKSRPEMADLSAQGYVPRTTVDYLREPDGTWRYELQLWERQ